MILFSAKVEARPEDSLMSDRKKILHIASHDHNWELFARIAALAAALREYGFTSTILAPEHSHGWDLAEASGVETTPFLLEKSLNPLRWKALADSVNASGAGIVHVHDPAAAAMLGYAGWFLKDVKIVTTRYGLDGAPASGESGRGVAAVICPSAAVADLFGAKNSASAGKVQIAYAGVNIAAADRAVEDRDSIRTGFHDNYCPDKEKPLFIVNIASMDANGGQLELLEVWQEVMAARNQCHLFLMGEGEVRGEIERQRKIMALEKDVTILEPDRAYLRLLAAADLFVDLSKRDGAGFMAEAALAAGRGVLLRKSGCYPELIEEGKSGILLGDEGNLLETLLEAIKNRSQREQLGKAGRERARKLFDMNVVAGKIAGVYAGL